MPPKDKPYDHKLPLFFNKKTLNLCRNKKASDELHDIKEFQDKSGTWVVKDIDANGRKRYDKLSPKIKSLLLQAEMMHSELFNYISGTDGPHYRIIIDDQQEVMGLASEKINQVDDFVNWLQSTDLKQMENQKKLHQYFKLLTAQMMIEDPDPNPYNIMMTPTGLVKIDEGWASYQLLLTIMQRPHPFEHDIQDIRAVAAVGAKALSSSLGAFPIGSLVKNFLPLFLTSLDYWFVQRQLIMKACNPFFAMDFNALHTWILSQQNEESTLLETLIAPTLVYHFITEKCSKFLSQESIIHIQKKCHQLIEKGLRELLDLIHSSSKTWFKKALIKTKLVKIPTAQNLESPAFAKVLFHFTDELLKVTQPQISDARQQIASKYDLTLQFQTMRHIEQTIYLIPWMRALSSSFIMDFASELSKNYYLTVTHYLLTNLNLIERAAILSRMHPEHTEPFINFHQKRQQQYRKKLIKDPHYRAYFFKNLTYIKQNLNERLDTFQSNNPFYDDLDLTASFKANFNEWHKRLQDNNLFSDDAPKCRLSP